MGSNQSVMEAEAPDTPLIRAMAEKHGKECTQMLPIWSKKYGFPEGGSLSTNQLKKLRAKLMEEREKKLKAKKVSTDLIKQMQLHDSCLSVWEGEASARDYKRTSRLLPGNPSEGGAVCGASGLDQPPAYTSTNPFRDSYTHTDKTRAAARTHNTRTHPKPRPETALVSSLYPDLSLLSAARVDPDLNSCPIRRPTAEPKEERDQEAGPADTHHVSGGVTDAGAEAKQRKIMPKAVETRSETAAKTTGTLPMVEVAGPEGPMFVYRPWTMDDIIKAGDFLPNPTTDSAKFSDEFMAFCQEYRPSGLECKRILAHKMKASDLIKVTQIPDPTLHPEHPDYRQNKLYIGAIKDLCRDIVRLFPARIDMAAINLCKQKPDEDVDDFVQRMTAVFDANCYIQKTTDEGARAYEINLCQAICRGLLPEIADRVNKSYIGVHESPTLDNVKAHARHAAVYLKNGAQKSERRRAHELHKATLTLYAHATGEPMMGQSNWRGRGRGRGQPRDLSHVICFNCGRRGHFQRNCPEPRAPRNNSTDFPPPPPSGRRGGNQGSD